VLQQAVGQAPQIISDEMADSLPNWDDSKYKNQEKELFSKYLSPKKSWSIDIELWGTEESDCIELIYESKLLAEFSIRLDLRHFNKKLIHLIEELGNLFDAVGINEKGEVFPLKSEYLKTEIQKSQAFRFVKDPHAFLDSLSSKKAER